jgi:hypothetical protein
MSVIRNALVFAAILLGACVSTAHAQETIVAKIPFAFVVGGTTLPAGEYEVRTVDAGGIVLAIEGRDNPSKVALATSNTEGIDPAGDEPALVFIHYENQYRLAQIWDSKRDGRELTGSSRHDARADTEHGLLKAQEYVLAANWK